MLRRFTSILVILIAFISFFVSSTFAQDGNMPGKKSTKKEHVIKEKTHKTNKEKKLSRKGARAVKIGHRKGKKAPHMKKKVKAEKNDSRIKVN